jgi:hypothetical protein
MGGVWARKILIRPGFLDFHHAAGGAMLPVRFTMAAIDWPAGFSRRLVPTSIVRTPASPRRTPASHSSGSVVNISG